MDRLEAQLNLFTRRILPGLVVCAVAVIGVLRFDVKIGVSYEVAKVLQSRPLTGKASFNRVVLIEIDGKPRIVLVDDWHNRTEPGRPVCVSKNRFLLRRWTRYGLEVPFYCPQLRIGRSNGLSSPTLGPNVGQP